MKNNFILVLEIVWITTGLLCTGAAIRSIISVSINHALIFASMALVSFAFALFRHKQRKKS